MAKQLEAVFQPEALEDVKRILASLPTGARPGFLEDLESSVRQTAISPDGAPEAYGCRRRALYDFPYVIRYKAHAGESIVLSVFHERHNPVAKRVKLP